MFHLLNEQELLGKWQVIMPHRKARSINQRQLGLTSGSFPRVTIRSLPDNVLLDIFDICQMSSDGSPPSWHVLAHVCRNWRHIVFASPLRLNLQLECNADTPVKKALDVWPRAFPIVIDESRSRLPLSGANIIAALEHHDRVSEIYLDVASTVLKRLYKVMKKPYPVLKRLRLEFKEKSAPVLHDTFLGGSSPRLTYLSLIGIPFPALPNFLPFFHALVDVRIAKIPDTGYISPGAMAIALSALTKLKRIYIGLESPASHPDPESGPPSSLTRVVLPALTQLCFHGTSEYFEDLVARIDTPATIYVETSFFNQLEFGIPHFGNFIGRTKIYKSFEEATLFFYDESVFIRFGHRDPPGERGYRIGLVIRIWCHALDWQVACVAQICGKISPFLSNVEWLFIGASYSDYGRREYVTFSDWKDYVDNPQWLEIFHAFSALQHMQIPPKLGEIVGSALQELTGERVMDALPMLHHLYLLPPSAFTQRAIQPFISSRQRSNHPVIAHVTRMA